MDNWKRPFSVSIPPSAALQAPSSQNLKGWRVSWRLDICIDHVPIPYVGNRIAKTFLLDIVDHRMPSIGPPSPLNEFELDGTHINLSPAHGAFGPNDSIGCSYNVRSQYPIKKVSLVLQRRINISGVEPMSHSIASTSIPHPSPHKTISLVLPKRGAKWEVGETISTSDINVSFHLQFRVSLKGEKPVEYPPIPIHITGVAKAEQAAPPSPVRIRRSGRRGLYMQQGTIDISDPIVGVMPAPTKFTLPPRPPLKPILLTPEQTGLQSPPTSVTFPDDGSLSILRRYQQTGRRISTTASEEEDLQPLRSRAKTKDVDDEGLMALTPPASPGEVSL